MKIIINYELMDKVQEAKIGFSLKKYKQKLGMYLGLIGFARFSAVTIGGMPIEEALKGMIFPTIYGSSYFGISDWSMSKYRKEIRKSCTSSFSKNILNLGGAVWIILP